MPLIDEIWTSKSPCFKISFNVREKIFTARGQRQIVVFLDAWTQGQLCPKGQQHTVCPNSFMFVTANQHEAQVSSFSSDCRLDFFKKSTCNYLDIEVCLIGPLLPLIHMDCNYHQLSFPESSLSSQCLKLSASAVVSKISASLLLYYLSASHCLKFCEETTQRNEAGYFE